MCIINNDYVSHSIEVEILADNKLIVKNGTTTVELSVDKERLCRCVRQQVEYGEILVFIIRHQ